MFAAYFILRVRDTHLDFLRLLFLVSFICSGTRTFIAAKKSSTVKRQKTRLQAIILNQIACYVPTKSDVNQTCQQSVFWPIGS